jgi:hypothetical protein
LLIWYFHSLQYLPNQYYCPKLFLAAQAIFYPSFPQIFISSIHVITSQKSSRNTAGHLQSVHLTINPTLKFCNGNLVLVCADSFSTISGQVTSCHLKAIKPLWWPLKWSLHTHSYITEFTNYTHSDHFKIHQTLFKQWCIIYF